MQNLFYMADRGAYEIAASRSQDLGKEEQNMLVQTTNEVENRAISGEERGAHSHTLAERQTQEEQQEQEESPPDPSGKGKLIDITF